jgi:hypothetical protein
MAMAPPHLFRRKTLDFITIGNGWMQVFGAAPRPCVLGERLRQQRRRLRTRRQRRGTCGRTKRKFQKVPTLHRMSLFFSRVMRSEVSLQRYEPYLNCAFRFRLARVATASDASL